MMMTQNQTPNTFRALYALALPLAFLLWAVSPGNQLLDRPAASGPEVDQMPQFPGCEQIEQPEARQKCATEKLFGFIGRELKYPAEAREQGVEGKVIVSFEVAEDGSLRRIKAVAGLGGGCTEEALRVVRAMPNWNPGMKDGKPVAVELKLPFVFRLPDETAATDSGDVYKVVEQMPEFAGCERIKDDKERADCSKQSLFRYLIENLKYPEEAEKEGKEGMVIVQFVVDEYGSVVDPKIMRGIGYGCDEEVLRLVRDMPRWTPGVQGGKKVKVALNLPVRFTLPEEKAEVKNDRALQLENFSALIRDQQLQVRFQGEAKPLTLRVVDASGRQVWSRSYPAFDGQLDEQINLSDQSLRAKNLFVHVEQDGQAYNSQVISAQ